MISSTKISYAIAKAGEVELCVYNISGQLVRTLEKGCHQPGYYNVKWDGRDDTGKRVAAGIYIYRLKTEAFVSIKKMAVIK
jgi:flagellar hook assembly protein FlgD